MIKTSELTTNIPVYSIYTVDFPYHGVELCTWVFRKKRKNGFYFCEINRLNQGMSVGNPAEEVGFPESFLPSGESFIELFSMDEVLMQVKGHLEELHDAVFEEDEKVKLSLGSPMIKSAFIYSAVESAQLTKGKAVSTWILTKDESGAPAYFERFSYFLHFKSPGIRKSELIVPGAVNLQDVVPKKCVTEVDLLKFLLANGFK